MRLSPHPALSSQQALTCRLPADDAPIVLDTNVVLDWLLFSDPSSTNLAAAIVGGRLRWVASLAMRDELAEVLRRSLAQARGVDAAEVLAAWDTHVTLVASAPPLPATFGLQCTDRDDQKFLDLALAEGAPWLLSRDHALLKLARRARRCGLTITIPDCWQAP